MAAKKTMYSSFKKIPTVWIIAGILFFCTVVVAGAANLPPFFEAQKAGINEIRTTGVLEGSFTGTVSREAANAQEKERYVLTTTGGTKYILIGLKRTETPKPSAAPKNDKEKGKPSAKPTPKTSPRAEASDINSFEQYVGEKVTISGIVVPVENEPKASNEPQGKGKGLLKSPTPKSTPQGGWDYSRLVVKEINLAQ